MRSIRRRLVLALLLTTGLVWCLMALRFYHDARHEMLGILDAQLAGAAHLLVSLMNSENAVRGTGQGLSAATITATLDNRYQKDLAFQIWDSDDHLLARSDSAPATPLGGSKPGFSSSRVDGQEWRVFSLVAGTPPLHVIMGERADLRREVTRQIATRLALPVLVFLPLLALFIWFSVGRGLRPLKRISAQIAAREPDNLEYIEERGVPEEAAPLVQSLNELFRRLERAFERERRFTADAAHELRTPLAALKTQAEVALQAPSDPIREQALERVLSGVDRATHLVQQLLTLARLDPDALRPRGVIADLGAIVREVATEYTVIAAKRRTHLALDLPAQELSLSGDATALAIVIRNLIDNAVRYTPTGGRVVVSVTAEPHALTLSVSDDGPGIAPADRERALERFYRGIGTKVRGSGLGLSIVHRIVTMHDGTLSLGEAGIGGLLVRVTLPRDNDDPRVN